MKQYEIVFIILKIANSFITLSKGVDAWKDISFQKTDVGKTYFKGAAFLGAFGT